MTDDIPLRWLRAQRSLDLRMLCPPGDPEAGFSVIQPTELTDPREFLQPRAVVLTVGVALSRDVSDDNDPFPAYVDRLAEAGVTAVGVGTGLFFPAVPDSLVTAARGHGIAVFEVPRHTAFISILNAVTEERARRSRRGQEGLVVAQEKLSAAAVRGGLDELVTTTARQLDAAVAVTDSDGRVHGHHDRAGRSAVAVARRQCASGADSDGRTWRITQRMSPQGDRFHLVTVVAGHTFSPHDRSVIKHAAGLADILLQRPAYLRRSRTGLNSLALQLLLGLDGGDQSMGRVLDDAADGDGLVRPVVVAADRRADLDRAVAAADRAASRAGRHIFVTDLPGTDADAAGALFLFRGSRAVAAVAEEFGDAAAHVRVAVGEPVAWGGVTNERVQRLEAAARALTPGRHVGPYEAGAGWLGQPEVRSALDRRAAETVDRLAPDGDLSTTLLTWLRSGARVAPTAEALGVHRHTVRSRLDRVAAICEVDLDDPVVRAELLLVSVRPSGR
ncbi:helix-turn-helix domain-containing protein [Corynebacterium kalidii]